MEVTDLTLNLLETITNQFSEEHKIGKGGYGEVYRAELNGCEIAVKKLYLINGLDDKSFTNEFRQLMKVQHENIIRLIGYCYEIKHKHTEHNGQLVFSQVIDRALCFEYMPEGSLANHISDDSCIHDWATTYKIIKGTCEGLHYLHKGRGEGDYIYHLDLKPDNILLGKDLIPKIADFGLSRLFGESKTHETSSRMKGTFGFMAPEYIHECAISPKNDVFSLGVIIFYLVAGRKGYGDYCDSWSSPRQAFIERVIGNWDRRLPRRSTSSYSSHKEDILRVKMCVQIALRCVEKDRKKRPSIKDIVQELEELEAEIKKMSLESENSEDLITQTSSGCSTVLSFDPSQELRFLFEPGMSASTCLQLTNMTEGFIVFNIKTNKRKYCAQPDTGVMPPCSKLYISVTLKAQEEAPLNMQCHDMLVVQSAHVNEDLISDEISNAFLEEGKVDIMKMPIVYIAADQFLM